MRQARLAWPLAMVVSSIWHVTGLAAGGLDEFKLKRQEIFEFTEKPRLARSGDRVTLAFASKACCDVTVAVEDTEGRIVRHLASGVLGPNAPAPFQKNSLNQVVVWDGKDDRGRYLDALDGLVVRVSLGLKPRFEKNLLWEPKRRVSVGPSGGGVDRGLPTPLIQAAPDGVYVYEGRGMDLVKVFDHEGNYLRTVYPFPADKLEQVTGLQWHAYPQGDRLPLKIGFHQATFLSSGTVGTDDRHSYFTGCSATALAVRNGRLALVQQRLNRLATDGSSGGLPLAGPAVTFPAVMGGTNLQTETVGLNPTSAALSPDGKRLYLTGYHWRHGRSQISLIRGCLPGVAALDFEKDGPPAVFAGSMKQGALGADDGHFTDPTAVACDQAGRVYVADYMNDRIQVFSPAGQLLKSIREVQKPARLAIHQRTGQIYVCSWKVENDQTLGKVYEAAYKKGKKFNLAPVLTRLGAFDDPRPQASYPLPFLEGYDGYRMTSDPWGGLQYYAEVDSWADPPTIWLMPGDALKLFVEKDGKLELKRDFGPEVAKSIVRPGVPEHGRQRLYVQPKTGTLYVGEGQTMFYKAFHDVLEINPDSGKIRVVRMPFDAEELAFDLDGLAYLREQTLIARYDPSAEPWREVPFDYGEERDVVSCGGGRKAAVISGIPIYTGTMWHKGGMCVSPKGHIAVSCLATKSDTAPVPHRGDPREIQQITQSGGRLQEDAGAGTGLLGKAYTPRFYPGRLRLGEVHVFDKHGKMLYEDAIMGLNWLAGVGLDRDDHLYVLHSPTRVLGGERYFDDASGTLMKFKPGQGKISTDMGRPWKGLPFPLTPESRPQRPPDLQKRDTNYWVEGAEWMYGGAGFSPQGPCNCWNARFVLDDFGRSFVPEVARYQVAVLDSNGNLILRLGRYGNADSAGPQSRVPLGGDEVGLMHAQYLATHSDRRLFVADIGNQRIVSVRLEYHVSAAVPLRQAGAQGKP